ncbi:MAG: glycosyltransferase family 4 protein [bacterium]|nr:glycosyltransferase family 4 protein [bacterium]
MAKIVFIDLLFNWPPDGGARVDLKEVMTRLAAAHDVTLLAADFRGYFPRGRIEGEFPFRIVRVPFTAATFNAWTVPRAFRRLVDGIGPDRVFIADGWYLKFPLAAALAPRRPILRFYAYEGLCIKHYGTQFRYGRICPLDILTHPAACRRCAFRHHRFRPLDAFSHEFLSSLAFTPLYRAWVLRAIRSASRVIVYNSFMRETIIRWGGSALLAPSGVDPAAFRVPAAGRPAGPCTILMTSRTGDENKGFRVLAEACRIMRERRLDFRIVVPTYSEPSVRDEAIRYLPWQPPEKLPALYAAADICVVPSVWREPFGIAAVEAMAAGRPVVASRSGGLADIVEDGATGLLVEPGDARALAAALERLVVDPALRGEMGRAGRERAERLYSWEAVMRTVYLPLFSP